MLFFSFDKRTGEIETLPSSPDAVAPVRTAELVEEIAKTLGLSPAEVGRVTKQLLATVAARLKTGQPVVITGFGKFKPRKCRTGKSRDPRNGKRVKPTGRRSVTFRPSNHLKSLLV